MALNKNKDLKTYYNISEVSEMFKLPESTLRFWEKEFSQITPEKNARGSRRYTKDDIEQIRIIHHLVKEKGMTLAGARDTLKNTKHHDLASQHSELIDRLTKIRDTLQDLSKGMNDLV